MINKSVDEAVFDAILTKAFRDAAEADMREEELDTDFVPVTLTPKQLKIEKAAYHRAHTRRKRAASSAHYPVLRRIVSCILIVATVGFATIFAIPPIRAAVVGAVVEFFDKYTVFHFAPAGNAEPLMLGEYRIGYIPKDFDLAEQSETRLLSKYTFYHAKTGDTITIKIFPANSLASQVDEKYSQNEETVIKGYPAYWIESDTYSNCELAYSIGNHVIEIGGDISPEEILSIAENISKN